MSPNPTAQRHLVKQEEVDDHRCVTCGEYDVCLDAALRQSWRSWSCGQCGFFARARALRAIESALEWTLRPSA
jgi:predicted RNA-binding Zn-ribbon protein involved in translation (DUF1610 family)